MRASATASYIELKAIQSLPSATFMPVYARPFTPLLTQQRAALSGAMESTLR